MKAELLLTQAQVQELLVLLNNPGSLAFDKKALRKALGDLLSFHAAEDQKNQRAVVKEQDYKAQIYYWKSQALRWKEMYELSKLKKAEQDTFGNHRARVGHAGLRDK